MVEGAEVPLGAIAGCKAVAANGGKQSGLGKDEVALIVAGRGGGKTGAGEDDARGGIEAMPAAVVEAGDLFVVASGHVFLQGIVGSERG